VPSVIYGPAWKQDRTRALTSQAIDSNFRFFDIANQPERYVEEAVGAVMQDTLASEIVTREERFI
jgi:hypothetical protein